MCALRDEIGPHQPTLCAGWRTIDLAAHLVLRERRPDAGLGVLGGPLAGHTRKVQDHIIDRTPFPRLGELVRTGPPRLALFAIPGADERANPVEYFVHHEDVRRAQPGWEPRAVDKGLSDLLWRRLKLARLMLRKAPVGVEFAVLSGGVRMPRTPVVEVVPVVPAPNVVPVPLVLPAPTPYVAPVYPRERARN